MMIMSTIHTDPNHLYLSTLSRPHFRSSNPIWLQKTSSSKPTTLRQSQLPPVVLAMKPSGGGAAASGQGSTGGPAAAPGSSSTPGAADSIPGWAKWAAGAALLLAIPFCRRLMKFEGRVEAVARIAAEDVEKVAPVVRKLAADVAEAMPKGSILAEDLEIIESVAEKASEGAKAAEAFIDTVDEIKEEVDKLIEPIIKKEVEHKNGKL